MITDEQEEALRLLVKQAKEAIVWMVLNKKTISVEEYVRKTNQINALLDKAREILK